MNADELSDTARRGGACVGRGFHRGNVAADDGGDETRIDFLPPDENDVSGLDHRIDGFDHPYEAPRLDQAERFADFGLG